MASAWFPVVVIVLALAISGSTAADTVYDILRYYGFPPGLIPTGVVRRYELNPNTGQFALYLNTTCRFTAFNYDVQFRTQITGVIQNEEIMNLRGVQVRIMSYWATMVSVEMVEEDEDIEFSVGYTAVDMPAFYFYDVPQCGCGFDCP